MPTTGTVPARISAARASINPDHVNIEPKLAVPARVREGAQFFFWIVALAGINSVFAITGSHIHHFTGFGVTAMIGSLVQQLIVNGWMAGGFLILGFCAAEGRKWAFAAGMLVYAVDGALLVAAGDYVSAAVHAGILFAIYRGFAALGESSGSEPYRVASVAHAD
jgi:hypothetical protein